MITASGWGSAFDSRAAYRITVQGTISTGWSARLEGMAVSHTELEDGTPVSILTGELIDQAALTGVLNTIYELHLPLIDLTKLSVDSYTGDKDQSEGQEPLDGPGA
jgi:hypothetical protein